jgi:hypothetical protein
MLLQLLTPSQQLRGMQCSVEQAGLAMCEAMNGERLQLPV